MLMPKTDGQSMRSDQTMQVYEKPLFFSCLLTYHQPEQVRWWIQVALLIPVLLEMRNLLPECCQFVTFLSPLVAAQHGAPLSPGPSSWLWAQVWTRRDCFAAPVGHFTISFSLRNFKKPSRPHYLCTSFKATVAWLGSAKAAAWIKYIFNLEIGEKTLNLCFLLTVFWLLNGSDPQFYIS